MEEKTKGFLGKIDKKKFLIFSVIFVLVIIIIWFFFSREKPEPSPPPPPPPVSDDRIYQYSAPTEEICRGKETQEEKEKCFDDIKLIDIIEEENIKKCLEIKTIEKRDDCIKSLAAYYSLKNDDLCLAISDKQKRSLCIDRITISLRDSKLCEKHFGDEPFEEQECKDRITALEIGEKAEPEEIYKCMEIKSLEYPRLCLWMSFKEKFNNNCQEVPLEVKAYCEAYYTILNANTEEECESISFLLEEYKKFCKEKVAAGGWQGVADLDSDNDGITDWNDLFMGLGAYNPDTDGDGLKDGEEFDYGTNPKEEDTDKDGLTDYEEIKTYQTHPNKPDTDGDGILDGAEVKNGTDPIGGDKDKDGLSDEFEAKIGTNPNKNDTDGDGISDGEEWKTGLDAKKKGEVLADTDNDGLLDLDELFYGTDRLSEDTDGDGVSDKKEIDALSNPLGEGDMDFDKDGLTDKEEEKYGTNPSLADTDGDGISDFDEIKNGTDPKVKN